MAALTLRLALPLVTLLLAASAAQAQRSPAAAPEQIDACTRMLLEAAGALRNEQYPSMAQVAADRQRECPGPDSQFLLGIAKANMIHKGLVGRESEPLVVAQAIHALSAALDSNALRGEWLQSANAWLQYLDRVEREQARRDATPPARKPPSPPLIPPAAAPFEPSPSHLGPLLFGSAGIVMLGAGVVTAIVAGSGGPYDDSSALDTATTILLLSGGAALLAGLTWHLLTPLPSDTVQVSVTAHFAPTGAAATWRMSF